MYHPGIQRNKWAEEVNIMKIRDYTHVFKIEFSSVETAEMAPEIKVLLFFTYI